MKLKWIDIAEPSVPFLVCRWFCHRILDEFFDFTTSGEEYVPAVGPCIIAANHVSFLDPPAVVISSGRNAFSMARSTLSSGGIWHWMFSRMRTISIDRDGGNDLAAMRESVRLLEEGSALVLFPEGSRSPDGTIQPAKRGVGLLASMAKVPIIPARIFGSYEAWGRGMSIPKFFSRIHVAFAAPLLPEEYLARCDGSNRHQFIVNLVMERISQIESSYIFR